MHTADYTLEAAASVNPSRSPSHLRSQLLAFGTRHMDEDTVDYIFGYLTNTTMDQSPRALREFVTPFLEEAGGTDEEIEAWCRATGQGSSSYDTTGEYGEGEEGDRGAEGGRKRLEKAVHMGQAASSLFASAMATYHSQQNGRQGKGGALGDIRHVGTRAATKASVVNQKKLRLVEKRIQEKRAARGDVVGGGVYEPELLVPTWNPDLKPAMVVNQAKKTKPSTAAASGKGHGSSDGGRSKDIRIENFDIQFAGRKILENADLFLGYGRRYGLVGKNGVGKSTLLRAIAQGELVVPAHIRVLHVEQEIAGDDTPALQSVLASDTHRTALLAEESHLTTLLSKSSTSPADADAASARLKELYAEMEEAEVDMAEAKASSILKGLGFSAELQGRATKTFSGGWRMRLALARALFMKPDLLLADEVTNYLDFPAVVWLEQYLINWPSTLLVVSHDRSFLDAVATDILHLAHTSLTLYRNASYTHFAATRAERLRERLRDYESQKKYRQGLEAFVARWRYNAKRAAQAQSKLKVLEKLGELKEVDREDLEDCGMLGEGGSVYFTFEQPESLSPPILQCDEVSFAYPPPPATDDTKSTPAAPPLILENISFDLQMNAKVAIVGPNGAGKSTLLGLLTGKLQPSRGVCVRHGRLRMGVFSQHHVDGLVLGMSSVQFLRKVWRDLKSGGGEGSGVSFGGYGASLENGELSEEVARATLGRFGLTGTTPLQPIGTLSGGQKSRVVFAAMALSHPHVLILDEPTNHLDMESIDALARALREFRGGVAVVSHDERFLDEVCGEVWVCAGGTLGRFEGRVGDGRGVVAQYKASLLAESV